jgi:hypothetical protein
MKIADVAQKVLIVDSDEFRKTLFFGEPDYIGVFTNELI